MSMMLFTDAYAATKSDLQKDKAASQSGLKDAQNKASELEGQKSDAQEQVDESQQQLVTLLSNVDILESDIKKKDTEIADAQTQYDAALAEEQKQYKAMCARIKYMYENGDSSSEYIKIFLNAESITDALNKVGYAEKLYEYDRTLLVNYQDAKAAVQARQQELEDDKSEMEELKSEYDEQENDLNDTISQQQAVVSDFSSKLASAKSEAKAYQKKIDADNAQIATIVAAEKAAAAKKAAEEKAAREAAEKKAAEEAAANQTADSGSSDSGSSDSGSSSSGGSGTGSDIAGYAQQFVGNPYVAGGTSLTNGCDCSGFTSSVYAHFGYSIPRTSGSQAGYGTSVSYSDAQPGDLICYPGHVAIYIGNGRIVHASTEATGIKISVATYRTILSIRRIV